MENEKWRMENGECKMTGSGRNRRCPPPGGGDLSTAATTHETRLLACDTCRILLPPDCGNEWRSRSRPADGTYQQSVNSRGRASTPARSRAEPGNERSSALP